MDGSTGSSPELQLPKPSVESGGDKKPELGSVEKAPVSHEGMSQQGPVMPMPMVDPNQFAVPLTPPLAAQPSPPVAAQYARADDTDVIEKEWVQKAKDIVARTGNDPREQSSQLGKFKAEYMKKRFNKELKQANEA